MEGKLSELEKVVSQVTHYISRLQKDKSTASKSARSGPSPSQEKVIRELTGEIHRLKEERKDLRKRVRAIIKDIDKVNL